MVVQLIAFFFLRLQVCVESSVNNLQKKKKEHEVYQLDHKEFAQKKEKLKFLRWDCIMAPQDR